MTPHLSGGRASGLAAGSVVRERAARPLGIGRTRPLGIGRTRPEYATGGEHREIRFFSSTYQNFEGGIKFENLRQEKLSLILTNSNNRHKELMLISAWKQAYEYDKPIIKSNENCRSILTDGSNARVRRRMRHVSESRTVSRAFAVRTAVRIPRVRPTFHVFDAQTFLQAARGVGPHASDSGHEYQPLANQRARRRPLIRGDDRGEGSSASHPRRPIVPQSAP
ncbi:unnamed protein product [Nesidiocoris tenuis]|uniref:Uncharacterized protein n=1 Tax=Nesidiocoris tenuis TaxID=355587 RepID=A0A6H5G488_9HEMI|nr:unnamed protein product [Nesidiocoris tenuis]